MVLCLSKCFSCIFLPWWDMLTKKRIIFSSLWKVPILTSMEEALLGNFQKGNGCCVWTKHFRRDGSQSNSMKPGAAWVLPRLSLIALAVSPPVCELDMSREDTQSHPFAWDLHWLQLCMYVLHSKWFYGYKAKHWGIKGGLLCDSSLAPACVNLGNRNQTSKR